MGIKSQRKGRAAELELARILRDQGIPAEPGKPVSFGETPDITGIPGIHAEVKRRENVNLTAALAQAAEDAVKFGDGLPAVFHRANRQSWRVTMSLPDWLTLYCGYKGGMAPQRRKSPPGTNIQDGKKQTPNNEKQTSS